MHNAKFCFLKVYKQLLHIQYLTSQDVIVSMKKCTIQRISIILALLFMASCLPLSAQRQALKNIPYIDQRRVHYGFLLGMDMSDITFVHSGANDWVAECPGINPAFCVGLMGDVALTENLNVRCTPMLHFMSREVHFRNVNTAAQRTQNLKSNYISLPLSLKVCTRRLNNYRPYFLLGAQMDWDLAHEEEQPIVFQRCDIGLHVALGCDAYLRYFKFCPEIRFNLGLLNMIDHDRNGLKDKTMMTFTEAIDKAHNKSISLLFFFE